MIDERLGVIESSGKGVGSFRAPIYFGDPLGDANARIAQEQEQERVRRERELQAVPAGPMQFTTDARLVPWPYVVWDVNGYYRDLGAPWWSTKTQLREAYQAGPITVRRTYIMKQLLDPKTRRRYDSCAQGSVFFDRYVEEDVKRLMLEEQVAAQGRIMTFDDRATSEAEIDLADYLGREFDEGTGSWADEGKSAADRRWRFGYYLWGTSNYDTELLRGWQECLLRVAARRRLRILLSVGLLGWKSEETGSVVVKTVGYRTVAFLNESLDPTSELAEEVFDLLASTALNQPHH